MNDKKAAQAIRTIIIGLDELAAAFDESPVMTESPRGSLIPASIPELPPVPLDEEEEFLADAAFPPKAMEPVGDQGFAAQCPKHKKAFRKSNYEGKPAYCTSPTDDPIWGKSRDGKLWCTINSSNVHTWLKAHSAAA